MRAINYFILPFLVFATATITPHAANAADSPPDALTDKAAALYDEGVVAYKKSKWDEARASFLAAWSLKKHWQIAGSLGDCEAKLGLYRDAAEHLAYFLRLSPKKASSEDAKTLYANARAKTGALTIVVDTPGADILIDGTMIGKAPLEDPAFVSAGRHTIEARRGAKLATATLDAVIGANRQLALTLATAPNTDETRSKGPSIPMVVGGAILTVAAAGTGIALFVVSGNKAGTADTLLNQMHTEGSTCTSPPQPGACSDLLSLRQDQGTFHNVAIPLFVVAGVAAAGTLTYALWPRGTVEPAVKVAPVAGPGGSGIWVTGRF
jgi:hypothetical protein